MKTIFQMIPKLKYEFHVFHSCSSKFSFTSGNVFLMHFTSLSLASLIPRNYGITLYRIVVILMG